MVRNYRHHVDRLRAKYILVRNFREGKPKAKEPGDLGDLEKAKGEFYFVLSIFRVFVIIFSFTLDASDLQHPRLLQHVRKSF